MNKPFWILEEISKFVLYLSIGQLVFFILGMETIDPRIAVFFIVAGGGLLSVIYAARKEIERGRGL